MDINSQLLINELKKEEQAALEEVQKQEKFLKNWDTNYAKVRPDIIFKKSIADKRLADIKENIEKAKKDPSPALTLAIKNHERSDNNKFHFKHGSFSPTPDIAYLYETIEQDLIKRLDLEVFDKGAKAGRTVLKDVCEQFMYNALMNYKTLRRYTPEEVIQFFNSMIK